METFKGFLKGLAIVVIAGIFIAMLIATDPGTTGTGKMVLPSWTTEQEVVYTNSSGNDVNEFRYDTDTTWEPVAPALLPIDTPIGEMTTEYSVYIEGPNAEGYYKYILTSKAEWLGMLDDIGSCYVFRFKQESKDAEKIVTPGTLNTEECPK